MTEHKSTHALTVFYTAYQLRTVYAVISTAQKCQVRYKNTIHPTESFLDRTMPISSICLADRNATEASNTLEHDHTAEKYTLSQSKC